MITFEYFLSGVVYKAEDWVEEAVVALFGLEDDYGHRQQVCRYMQVDDSYALRPEGLVEMFGPTRAGEFLTLVSECIKCGLVPMEVLKPAAPYVVGSLSQAMIELEKFRSNLGE